jgi:hypothetical protein
MKKINYSYWFTIFALLWLTFTGCKKSEQFYDQLKALPQIDQRTGFAYKPAYVTGDTMVITGLMKPLNTLQITIGGVKANIISSGSIKYQYPGGNGVNGFDSTYVDQVKLIITKAMEGKAREVKVTNNGNSITGPVVDVFSYGGTGSFQDSLKLVAVKTFADSKNTFLYSNNGKGDMYYYAPGTHDLRHIWKDGREEIMFDLSNLTDQFGNYTIGSCITGGVNPQGTTAYLSVIADDGAYKFLKLDIQNKRSTTLNRSAEIGAPFEGSIGQVKIIVNGIYPDSKGNVYLGIGGNGEGKTPNAIAIYTENSAQLAYVFRIIDPALFPSIPGMPGVGLQLPASDQHIEGIRISPGENLLYALTFANSVGQGGVNVYDLSARVKLDQFQPNLPANVDRGLDILGPFSSLSVFWSHVPDRCFGYLPMPGKRLQTLQYQFYGPYGADPVATAQNGLPKWTVLDFTEQRIYAYAPGRCNVGSFAFGPYSRFNGPSVSAADQLLNYDEDGHLYMTAKGKTALVKTQVIQ